MKISVVGAGYVGLVTGACFADLGNQVYVVDIDKDKIEDLKKGNVPIYEPGLEEMVRRNLEQGRLVFGTEVRTAVHHGEVIFIAVGTPAKEYGEADLSYVEAVARSIAKNMPDYRLVVEKSTVPVNTGEQVKRTIRLNNPKKIKFDVASNPEFLAEGTAVRDFMNPDRIVIGVESKRAKDILSELYEPLKAPIVVTDIRSAEIIKHASNSLLATKISFINAVANVCEASGADITQVARGIGLDKRIGSEFLNAGVGYGGSCFPKDIDAFVRIADKLGYDFHLLKSVRQINAEQKAIFVRKIEDALWIVKGKTIAVLGLSFKPNTDDMREAPSVDVINSLQTMGATVKAYDPQAMEKAKAVLKDVTYCKDAYETVEGSDCMVVLTDWNDFKELDFSRVLASMRHPIIVDGRNIYPRKKMEDLGFQYFGVGH
ncbi:MAG: UDP-glucose/GDP-mannose dehydrogenase family protein [Candidatus Omnitrophica bacterium]|nr:UDP-glucose/GDP-mannose dehydrogenase family protein [Candidatus Omnitrophota bacterium]